MKSSKGLKQVDLTKLLHINRIEKEIKAKRLFSVGNTNTIEGSTKRLASILTFANTATIEPGPTLQDSLSEAKPSVPYYLGYCSNLPLLILVS